MSSCFHTIPYCVSLSIYSDSEYLPGSYSQKVSSGIFWLVPVQTGFPLWRVYTNFCLLRFIFILYMGVCMYEYHACAVPTEVRRHCISWMWTYRWACHSVGAGNWTWVLTRAVSALQCWAVSPGPGVHLHSLDCLGISFTQLLPSWFLPTLVRAQSLGTPREGTVEGTHFHVTYKELFPITLNLIA